MISSKDNKMMAIKVIMMEIVDCCFQAGQAKTGLH